MSLSGILRLEVQELRHDQVRDLVVDRGSEEDDPLVQQAGVDVERALAARRLLDHHRDQRAHAVSLLRHSATGGPQLRLGLGLFLVGRPDRLARLAPARSGSASPRPRPGRAPRAGAGPRADPRAGRGATAPRSRCRHLRPLLQPARARAPSPRRRRPRARACRRRPRARARAPPTAPPRAASTRSAPRPCGP